MYFSSSNFKNAGCACVKIIMFTSCFIPFHGLEYTGSGGPLVNVHALCHTHRMGIPRSDVDSASQIFVCLISPSSMKWG